MIAPNHRNPHSIAYFKMVEAINGNVHAEMCYILVEFSNYL